MSSPSVAIVFGAGKNIGEAVVKKFIDAGYRVAAVSRSATPGISEDRKLLTVQADLTQPSQVPQVFETVRQAWSAFPQIIVWNAARRSYAPETNNPFSIPLDELRADIDIANTSPWAAASLAVKNWKEGEKAAFIYTGNLQSKAIVPAPDFTTLGVAKRASTYWLEDADRIFKPKNWRFFYADERNPQGGPAGSTPGADSHAVMFLSLAEGREDLPTYVTFVNGEVRDF